MAHLMDSVNIDFPVWVATRYVRDTNNDGNPEFERFLRYDANGNVDLDRYDQDGDGIIDLIATYTYGDDPGWSRYEQDNGADGSLDRVRTLTYDDYGRIIEDTTLDNGTPSSRRAMTYDAEGRLLRREIGVLPNPLVETWQVDGNGLRSVYEVDRDSDGVFDQRSILTYDGAQRSDLWTLQEVDIGIDGTVDQRIERTHDSQGRLTSKRTDTDLDGVPESAESYTFGEFGQLRREITRNGNTAITVWTRDEAGRELTQEIDRDGDGSADYRQERSYDEDGREILRITDNDGDGQIDRTDTIIYDEAGKTLRRERDSDADGTADRIESYVYDELGRRTERLIDANADGTINERNVDADYVDAGIASYF